MKATKNFSGLYQLMLSVIFGNSVYAEEIIHLCEQNHSSFIDAYETAIILYKNDVFKYLYENEIVEVLDRKDLVILSIMNGNNEIFAFLQEKGVKINDRIIDMLANLGNFYLVKHFIKANKIPDDILIYAAESKNIELVKYLLKQEGIDINAQNVDLLCL